jgi:hypothetical protein
VQALAWYRQSIDALATPDQVATDQQRKELLAKLAAAQSLADENDDSGRKRLGNASKR